MAEPVRFSPDELDRIEDALESLEGAHALEDPSPQVRDVLESYRGILLASREAMPMEDVPAGVLAAVFAEAEASVAGAASQVAAPIVQPERPGFWTRLRKAFLIPSVALAGTAALVIVMSWSTMSDDSGMDRAESTMAANDKRDAPESKPAAEPAEEAAGAAAVKDALDADEDAPAAAAPPPAPGTVDSLATPKQKAEAPGLDPLGDVPEPEPEVTPTEPDDSAVDKKRGETASARWDLIERGDRAREDGDCAAARPDYMIATEDDDAGVRARAYAGLGLCNMMAGDDAGAEDAFERARGEDNGVEKFIQAERRPTGSYKAKPKKSRKRTATKNAAPSKAQKSKSAVDLDQTMDPFSP